MSTCREPRHSWDHHCYCARSLRVLAQRSRPFSVGRGGRRRPRVVSLAAPPAAWSPPWRAGASRSRPRRDRLRETLLGCREGIRRGEGGREPPAGPRPPGGGRAGVPPELPEPLAVRRRRAPRLRPERGHHVRHAPPQLGLRRQVSAGRAPFVPAAARRGPGYRGQVRHAQVRAGVPAAAVRGARERARRGLGLGAPRDRREVDAGVDAKRRVRRPALGTRREEPGEKKRKRRRRSAPRRVGIPRVVPGTPPPRGERERERVVPAGLFRRAPRRVGHRGRDEAGGGHGLRRRDGGARGGASAGAPRVRDAELELDARHER